MMSKIDWSIDRFHNLYRVCMLCDFEDRSKYMKVTRLVGLSCFVDEVRWALVIAGSTWCYSELHSAIFRRDHLEGAPESRSPTCYTQRTGFSPLSSLSAPPSLSLSHLCTPFIYPLSRPSRIRLWVVQRVSATVWKTIEESHCSFAEARRSIRTASHDRSNDLSMWNLLIFEILPSNGWLFIILIFYGIMNSEILIRSILLLANTNKIVLYVCNKCTHTCILFINIVISLLLYTKVLYILCVLRIWKSNEFFNLIGNMMLL